MMVSNYTFLSSNMISLDWRSCTFSNRKSNNHGARLSPHVVNG